MTIYELLTQDIQKLNNIRVPVGDLETIRAISEVASDLTVCIKAMEDQRARQDTAQPEEPKPEADNVE